jgi:hypothetical protein
MTFLIVGILVLALSFSIYTLIHFWAEAHLGPSRTRKYAMVMIRSTSLPRQIALVRKTPVVIATREMFASGARQIRSH